MDTFQFKIYIYSICIIIIFLGVILGSEGVAKGGKLLIKQCVLLKVYT